MNETTNFNQNQRTVEDIFDECLDGLISGQATLEQCLERYPEHTEELRSLLETALRLKHSPELIPSAGARQRVRYALNERMAEWSRPEKNRRTSLRFRLANIMVSLVMGFTFIGGGLAYASSGAMPDQTLYPVKTGLEQVMLSLAPGADARIKLYTAFNDRRVEEIMYLAAKGDSLGIAEITSRIADGFASLNVLFAYPENDLQAPPGMLATTGNGPDRTGESKDDLSPLLTGAQSSQLAVLSNVPATASPAVQLALEQAAEALRQGYASLVE